MKPVKYLVLALLVLYSCKKDVPQGETTYLQLISVSVGAETLSMEEVNTNLPYNQPLVFRFSQVLDRNSVPGNISLVDNGLNTVPLEFSYLDGDRTLSAMPGAHLQEGSSYTISIGKQLKGSKGQVFTGLDLSFSTLTDPLEIVRISIDGWNVDIDSRIREVSLLPDIEVSFSDEINLSDLSSSATLLLGSIEYLLEIQHLGEAAYSFKVKDSLPDYRKFHFILQETPGRAFEGLDLEFYTQLDSSPKFPQVSDEELLNLVQEQTFRYFWDFAHPVSGLSRERNTSGRTVTSGGSGFGIMAVPVGIERGFISRGEGISRLEKIMEFLDQAERFHGAWPHWLDGSTGKVIPFSSMDDGGDLVETSYLAMGLLTVRQYLNPADDRESRLVESINELWEAIEWDWYTQGENVLTWHWSPQYGWEKNHKIRGWNEALITYIMAASSPTYSISREVYEQGWGGGPNMVNGREFYGIRLPLGPDYGGPLFFEHYTFLGIDPRGLSDQYADYMEQAVNHSLINQTYCITNPMNYVSYSKDCWGLTASDGDRGYSAHSPTNDRGVISPTAAISSLPFTPEESMDAMRHFYYRLGDRLWGQYGFYDAFNVTASWYATSNIAIDQGPIILMIENYRTGLLWDLLMSAPEIRLGLGKLGFSF